MKAKKASEVMTRPVVSAKENASARDVALQLLNGNFSGMPVTDEEDKLVGIITEIDILDAVNNGKELVRTTAKDIMTADVTTACPDHMVDEIAQLMKEFNLIRIPIVKENKLVGVVSRGDILRSLIEPEFVSHM